jgi:hypothetical protein
LKHSPKWLSENPDEYLHPEHQALGAHIPVEWQNEYGRWRHLYMPGLREEVGKCFPGMNCARFTAMVRPIVPLVLELVPAALKSAISQHNPEDWTKLTDAQIRRAWNNEPMLFANAFLVLISFQISVFIQSGKLESLSLTEGNEVQGLTDESREQVLTHLCACTTDYPNSHIYRLTMHLATFQMATERSGLWRKVLEDEELVESFRRQTGQSKIETLKGLEEGDLISLLTAQRITKWIKSTLPEEPLFSWTYKELTSPRKTAATGERVPYCGRTTKFGTVTS